MLPYIPQSHNPWDGNLRIICSFLQSISSALFGNDLIFSLAKAAWQAKFLSLHESFSRREDRHDLRKRAQSAQSEIQAGE
jgi:hypothetical protein